MIVFFFFKDWQKSAAIVGAATTTEGVDKLSNFKLSTMYFQLLTFKLCTFKLSIFKLSIVKLSTAAIVEVATEGVDEEPVRLPRLEEVVLPLLIVHPFPEKSRKFR